MKESLKITTNKSSTFSFIIDGRLSPMQVSFCMYPRRVMSKKPNLLSLAFSQNLFPLLYNASGALWIMASTCKPRHTLSHSAVFFDNTVAEAQIPAVMQKSPWFIHTFVVTTWAIFWVQHQARLALHGRSSQCDSSIWCFFSTSTQHIFKICKVLDINKKVIVSVANQSPKSCFMTKQGCATQLLFQFPYLEESLVQFRD